MQWEDVPFMSGINLDDGIRTSSCSHYDMNMCFSY